MPSLIKVAKLKNLVDSPLEDRKMHRWSIPTLGGVVIFGAIVFSYSLWFPENYDFIDGMLVNFKFLISSLILLFFVGVKDDIIGTAPVKKLIAHIIVAFILVVMAGLRIESMQGIFGVINPLSLWQSYLLSILAYLVIINSINLIDGLDGLAGLVSLLASVFFGILFGIKFKEFFKNLGKRKLKGLIILTPKVRTVNTLGFGSVNDKKVRISLSRIGLL